MSRRSSTQTAAGEERHSTTSSPSVSGDYLRWLGSQIRGEDDGNPNRTYDGLLTIMYETEFVELVPNDHNRIGDGLDLRLEFCREMDIPKASVWTFLDKNAPIPACSFLEVLIGLSRRLEFNAGNRANRWAWELLHNLELHRITDPVGRSKAQRAQGILERCIWRTYSHDGVGGFFPLKRPQENQAKVEIWYQMAAYLDEMQRR